MSGSERNRNSAWPVLSYATLSATAQTLQLWSQIVGKIRLARTPWVNHSWHVALHLSARGLATPPVPNGATAFQLEFDFIDHQLVLRTTDGAEQLIPLAPGSVAEFHAQVMSALASVGAATRIVPVPNELAEAVPFAQDHSPRVYEPAIARDFWRAMVQIERVFSRFRSRFLGKSSPVHFFWGGADLALTRFSGRTAPLHPGGIPHLPDRVTRESYSHEVSSAGFWPGDARWPEPSFYSYAYPTPAGFSDASISPAGARFHETLGEFLLPYEAVQGAADPDEVLLSFLQTAYEAAADLGRWPRAELECEEGQLGRPRAVG